MEHVLESGVELDAIVQLVLAAESPTWELDLGDLYGRLPNLRGHGQIARLLVACALESARVGDDGKSDRLFRAAWRWRRSSSRDRSSPVG
ncbi:MAG: hypothetical protein U0166_05305 [Acidobacteriota bacterium]